MFSPPTKNLTLQQKTPSSSILREKDEGGIYGPVTGGEKSFMIYVANLSLEKKKTLVASPEVLDVILTPATIRAMDSERLVKLSAMISLCDKDDPIDKMIPEFPVGSTIAAGNHEMLVRMNPNQLAQFRRGKALEGATIRACLASQKDAIPSNILLVDYINLEKKIAVEVPGTVDTIILPYFMAASEGNQWVLLVARLTVKRQGYDCKLHVYNSSRLGFHLVMSKKAIIPVKQYLEKIMHQEKMEMVEVGEKCGEHANVADSGIALLCNALSVINKTPVDMDMSELACWQKRENYARLCLESVKANIETFERGMHIVNTMATQHPTA